MGVGLTLYGKGKVIGLGFRVRVGGYSTHEGLTTTLILTQTLAIYPFNLTIIPQTQKP